MPLNEPVEVYSSLRTEALGLYLSNVSEHNNSVQKKKE